MSAQKSKVLKSAPSGAQSQATKKKQRKRRSSNLPVRKSQRQQLQRELKIAKTMADEDDNKTLFAVFEVAGQRFVVPTPADEVDNDRYWEIAQDHLKRIGRADLQGQKITALVGKSDTAVAKYTLLPPNTGEDLDREYEDIKKRVLTGEPGAADDLVRFEEKARDIEVQLESRITCMCARDGDKLKKCSGCDKLACTRCFVECCTKGFCGGCMKEATYNNHECEY